MEVKIICPAKRKDAVKLIWDTFLEFEAPDYSAQGVETFRAFISNENIFETAEFFGAFENDALYGVIATRENRTHICCFFVASQRQKQGVGRTLWEYVKTHSEASAISVNSSPFAVPIYHRLGFCDTDTEQLTDGMRYTPMRFVKGSSA